MLQLDTLTRDTLFHYSYIFSIHHSENSTYINIHLNENLFKNISTTSIPIKLNPVNQITGLCLMGTLIIDPGLKKGSF